MCEWGNTVDVEVTVPADLSYTGEDRRAVKPIDSCLAPMVAALNAGGVPTRSSCCGHGVTLPAVILADHRVLTILPDPTAFDRAVSAVLLDGAAS